MSRTLADHILEFVVHAAACLRASTYPADRPLYHHDLAIAAIWLGDLHRGKAERDVAREITSEQMKRHFFDPWKQGEPGRSEVSAFAELLRHAEQAIAEKL